MGLPPLTAMDRDEEHGQMQVTITLAWPAGMQHMSTITSNAVSKELPSVETFERPTGPSVPGYSPVLCS